MGINTEAVELRVGQSHDAGRGGIVTRIEENLYKITHSGESDGAPPAAVTTRTAPVIGIDNWGEEGEVVRTTIVIKPAKKRPLLDARNGWPATAFQHHKSVFEQPKGGKL